MMANKIFEYIETSKYDVSNASHGVKVGLGGDVTVGSDSGGSNSPLPSPLLRRSPRNSQNAATKKQEELKEMNWYVGSVR